MRHTNAFFFSASVAGLVLAVLARSMGYRYAAILIYLLVAVAMPILVLVALAIIYYPRGKKDASAHRSEPDEPRD